MKKYLLKTLNLNHVTFVFYLQDAMLNVISTVQKDHRYYRNIEKIKVLEKNHEVFTGKLAEAFFTYIIASAMGEFRYIHELGYYYPEIMTNDGHTTRGDMQAQIFDYEPYKLLSFLHNVFSNYNWGNAYGGESWAKVCEAGYEYGKWPDKIFVDHVIDLQHNGGYIFDKGVIFSGSLELYKDLLDQKQCSDILSIDFLDMFGGAICVLPKDMLIDFIKTALTLKVITPAYFFKINTMMENNPFIFPPSPVWGTQTLSTNDMVPISQDEDEDKDEDENEYEDEYEFNEEKNEESILEQKRQLRQIRMSHGND